MKIIEPLETSCKRYDLPTTSQCYICKKEVKAIEFFAYKGYRTVGFEECCGASSARSVTVEGSKEQSMLQTILGEF